MVKYFKRNERLRVWNESFISIEEDMSLISIKNTCATLKSLGVDIKGVHVDFKTYNMFAEAKIKEILKIMKSFGFGTRCSIKTNVQQTFTESEISTLENLRKYIIKTYPEKTGMPSEKVYFTKVKDAEGEEVQTRQVNSPLFFATNHTNWSLNEVKLANAKIQAIKAETKDLSPFEKVAYVYSWLTEFVYNEGSMHNEMPHSIYGALNSDYIVCEAYANLMELLLNEAGVSCITNPEVHKGNDGQKEYHLSNVIHVVDPKYDVDGYYGLDACLDARPNKATPDQYALHFCMPLKYIHSTKPTHIENGVEGILSEPLGVYGFIDALVENDRIDFLQLKPDVERALKALCIRNRKKMYSEMASRLIVMQEMGKLLADDISETHLLNSRLPSINSIRKAFEYVLEYRKMRALKNNNMAEARLIRDKQKKLEIVSEDVRHSRMAIHTDPDGDNFL